jgi:hypothetical protein
MLFSGGVGNRSRLVLSAKAVNRAPQWPREVLSALKCRQGNEQIGQGDVGPEPRHQAVEAVAPGSTAALALDADDVQGKLAERVGR